MWDIVNQIGNDLGIAPATLAVYITILMAVSNVVSRKIPDTATGWLKYVRIAASVIGAHAKDNSGAPADVPEPSESLDKGPFDRALEQANAG